jgi:hypothetical protein
MDHQPADLMDAGIQRPNPFLSAPLYGLTHLDPGSSDCIPYAVPRGTFRADLRALPRIPGGPVNILTLASAIPGRMWAVSTERVAYVNAADGRFEAIATLDLPGATRVSEETLHALLDPAYTSLEQVEALAKRTLGPRPETVTGNGLYTVVDRDDVLYVNGGTVINAIGLVDPSDPAAGLEVKRSIDMADVFPPMAFPGYPPAVRLIGLHLTYDGHLIIGAFNGIAVVDRAFMSEPVVHTIEEGQFSSNSLSVDPDGGIYFATGSFTPGGAGILRRLVWTGTRISADEADGAWSSDYDGGDWAPSVKVGTGTGSTPTLMGFGPDRDHLVVITDGANRMKVVACWRDTIPEGFVQRPGTRSRRIADQIQITAGLPHDAPWVQSEQSVSVFGWGAFVVNNVIAKGHPDKLVDVLANGPVVAPPKGMERVEWDPEAHRWRSVWARGDLSSTSMVPVTSAASRLVLVNGYSTEDGWHVAGIDWDTGEVVHRTIFGFDNLGNGAYALNQVLEGGDLLFNSVGGPVRVPLSHMRPE